MGCQNDNWLDNTALEFPRFWFWVIHVIGIVIFFCLGMRFALRRASVPIIAYRLFRMLRHR